MHKKTRTALIVITVIAVTIVVSAVLGVSVLKGFMKDSYKPLPGSTETPEQAAKDAKKNLDSFTILLLGVDSREGERGARSDTVILATVNPHLEEVMLLSLPRDTYVNIPKYGNTKLNHAMAYGDVPLVKETIENFLSIKIDHYMTIDFEGFREAIDVLGGINIDVPKNMRYYDPTDGTNINLKKGYQLLDGKNALDYVRFRADAEADYGRMRRQQEFIRAIAEKATEFTSVTRVIPFIEKVTSGVKTDIYPTKMELLIRKFFGVRGDAIQSFALESRSYIGNDGIWYVDITKQERERIRTTLTEFKKMKTKPAPLQEELSDKDTADNQSTKNQSNQSNKKAGVEGSR